MDLKDQNTQLLAALKYLIWTKDFKENNGKCSAYEMHRKKAWKKANDIVDLCESQEPTSELNTKALRLQNVMRSAFNEAYDKWVECKGNDEKFKSWLNNKC